MIPVFQGLMRNEKMTNDRESKDPLVLGLLTLLSHQPLMSRRHLPCSYYTVSTTSMGGLLLYPGSGLICFVLVLYEFFTRLKNKSQQMCARRFNTLTIDEPATIGAVALVQLGQKRLDSVTVSLFAFHF